MIAKSARRFIVKTGTDLFSAGFPQIVDVPRVLAVAREDNRAVVAPSHDMMWLIRQDDSPDPWHRQTSLVGMKASVRNQCSEKINLSLFFCKYKSAFPHSLAASSVFRNAVGRDLTLVPTGSGSVTFQGVPWKPRH